MKSKSMKAMLLLICIGQMHHVKPVITDRIKQVAVDAVLDNKKKAVFFSLAGLAYGIWRLYPSVVQLSSSDPIVNELGYNPDPQNRHADLPTLKDKNVILGMHGFENPTYSFEDDYMKPKNMKIIACNPQTSCALPNPVKFVRSINFGQEKDALVIIKYLLLLSGNKNIKRIDGLGESRGGAAWIRVLTMLSNPQKYVASLKKLGLMKDGSVDVERVNKLKSMINQVYLAYPWLDSDYPFRNITKGLGYLQDIGVFGIKLVLHLFTDYSLMRSSTHILLKRLIEKGEFKLILDLAKGDVVVGNKYDEEFKNMKTDKFIPFHNTRYHMDRYNMFKALDYYHNN